MEAALTEYEIVPARDVPSLWKNSVLYRAIEELKKLGPDFVAKLKVPDDRRKYMCGNAHTYAERAGVTISTRYADGFLWIRCSGTRPQRNLDFTRKATATKILRELGK